MAAIPGQYGGITRRAFPAAGRNWRAGEEVSPEIAQTWKIQNRIGLGLGGYVYWYLAPDGGLRSASEFPDSILVVLPDGTELPSKLDRDEDGDLRATVMVPDGFKPGAHLKRTR